MITLIFELNIISKNFPTNKFQKIHFCNVSNPASERSKPLWMLYDEKKKKNPLTSGFLYLNFFNNMLQ